MDRTVKGGGRGCGVAGGEKYDLGRISWKVESESELPGVVVLCQMPAGEVPRLWATELTDTDNPLSCPRCWLPLREGAAQRWVASLSGLMVERDRLRVPWSGGARGLSHSQGVAPGPGSV